MNIILEKFRFIITFVLCVVGILESNPQNLSEENKSEIVNLYNQSQDYLSKGNYEKAIELKSQMYNKAIGLDAVSKKIFGGMSAFELAQIYSTVYNDLNKYIYWLEKSDQCGFSTASGRLGDAYLSGQDGVRPDYQKAKYYYDKCDEGRCKWIIATMYSENGELGRDDNKFLEYALLAVDKDDPDAQFIIGLFYLDGRMVKQDTNKGLTLIKKAAQQNHIKAIRFLESENIK